MSELTVPAPVRPEPRRDSFSGQYVIPDPATGKDRKWTRATTWAKTIEDNWNLQQWQVRMTALGLVQREDLFAGVASIANPDTKDGKKKLDEFCDAAREYAGASKSATIGSALHAFTQQLDMGVMPRVPAAWKKDVEAYQRLLVDQQITISPNYVERIVVLPNYGIAGTMDRLGSWRGKRLIVDLKTGKDLDYSWGQIAIQLAIYSRASYVFDVELNKHFVMPAVDRDLAIVIHLPAGKGVATPYLVDIREGWRMALICSLVRDYRKRKDLATSFEAALATGEVA